MVVGGVSGPERRMAIRMAIRMAAHHFKPDEEPNEGGP